VDGRTWLSQTEISREHKTKIDFRFIKVQSARMQPTLPAWLSQMQEEDLQFLKRFLLTSGSLKELADQYGVTYPTIRVRLDRVISHIRALDSQSASDLFEGKVRVLVAEGEISARVGKDLLNAHRAVIKGVQK
jgi:hypothetical protein